MPTAAAALAVEEPPSAVSAPTLHALIMPAMASLNAALAACATDERATVAYLLLARATITQALNAARSTSATI